MYISTSILSVEEEKAIKTFYNLEEAKTDYFHIDVMDGKFVKNNTHKQMLGYCNLIKQISNLPLDVHLMVEEPKKYVDEYLNFEPDIITFHIEACSSDEEIQDTINYIKENKIKAGISIKPETPVEKIYKFLPYVYIALIMTVEPGYGGQELIKSTIEKIEEIKKYIEREKLDTYIEADGGINLDNAEEIKKSGVDIIVSGNTIIKSENFKDVISKLRNI